MSKRHDDTHWQTQERTSGGLGVQDTGSRTTQRSHLRSIRIADYPTLTCLPRAMHITQRAFDLQQQTEQRSSKLEPNEVHGYTGRRASGAQQSRGRVKGTGGALGAECAARGDAGIG